jgi:hypothetical protein
MNDRDNLPDKDELLDILDDSSKRPNSVEANMGKTPENSTQSNFMGVFNNKASGQNETKDAELSQNQYRKRQNPPKIIPL